MAEVRTAVACRNTLGEGPVWCGELRILYWVDIEEGRLWRLDPRSGETQAWALPERAAACALRHNCTALLASASGLDSFDVATHTPVRLRDVALPAGARLNDGRCDRQGRFVFGCHVERGDATTSLFRFDSARRLETLIDGGIRTANSIAFSPDGRTLYFADSPRREIWAYEYPAEGPLGPRRLFYRLPDDEPGVPDGSAVDAEGFLWNARWGAGRLVRHAPDGSIERVVAVPASQPTSLAFGGDALDTIYVTSARTGLGADALAREPSAGSLFELRLPGISGLPEPRFAD
jgi:L-arabinonolactonase